MQSTSISFFISGWILQKQNLFQWTEKYRLQRHRPAITHIFESWQYEETDEHYVGISLSSSLEWDVWVLFWTRAASLFLGRLAVCDAGRPCRFIDRFLNMILQTLPATRHTHPYEVTGNAVVTCEIKLFWNNFRIISVFYFTCNHVWNWNKSISAADRVLKLFQNYFSDIEHIRKCSWAAINLR